MEGDIDGSNYKLRKIVRLHLETPLHYTMSVQEKTEIEVQTNERNHFGRRLRHTAVSAYNGDFMTDSSGLH